MATGNRNAAKISANKMQVVLIARFASRRGISFNAAAVSWVPARAAAFRNWYNKRVA